MDEKFDQAVTNTLGFYVYALADPLLSGSLQKYFYIGKGNGNRAFDHLNGEPVLSEMSLKLDRINEIRRVGLEPEISIIAHGLSEQEALRLEAQLIGIFDGLTNLVGGHYGRDFWLSTQAVRERYGKPVRIEELDGPVLFVSLNGSDTLLPYPDIATNADELKRRTLGDWTIGEKNSARVRCIVGCYAQLARCAYRVEGIEFERLIPPQRTGKGRSRWIGGSRDLQTEKKVFERIVVGRSGQRLTKFGQTPWNFSD